jgi:lysozyme family protein
MKRAGNVPSIRLLQRALNALNRGHSPALALDGLPGPRTAAALRALMARRGAGVLLRALAAIRGRVG